MTWHSLRRRFARTQVDLYEAPEKELLRLGGWDDIRTIQVRYYRSGEENIKSGTAG
ncbi:hypothetical protein SAMN04487968_10938 [Nocardioides terrae]|uniref:Phage integrase family protein n=1 Tax=Nocardioides terrae TaxID=574651 RepID=A0A1I1KW97_9ACTN|nr:hypothetical protein [Nocardioides terrae]SFC65011.1 hypothetical protein SAMN04487968_10938 [Nocardioides terrae]